MTRFEALSSFLTPASLPLSYLLSGVRKNGIGAEFSPNVTVRHLDKTVTETVIEGKNAEGLTVRAELFTYADAPVLEYTVYFRNDGETDTPILSDIDALSAHFEGSNPYLWHSTGDTRGGNGYHVSVDPIPDGEGFLLTPSDDGCSCNGAWSYTRVYFDEWTLTAVYGWTGGWKAHYTKDETGITLTAGQKYCRFVIHPGETMRTPRICLLVTEGNDRTEAMNAWRRFYLAHVMPKYWGQPMPPKACMHVHAYNGPEFFGATEDNQIFGLRQYIKKGLKPDVWWFDAGFYPLTCAPWPACGNLFVDETRFPNNGMRGIGDECEKNGTDLMVWFEPERSTAGSYVERTHPEFLITSEKPTSVEGQNSLINLGNPQAREWLTDRVDTFIKEWKIHIYRQDFNLDPFHIFRDNEEENRLGAVENLYIQGYYRFWDDLAMRNPGLNLDSCASGGRRNDYETMRRSVPYQYTDVACGNHPMKQMQHQMMFEWIPFFRAHTYADDNGNCVDEFAFFNAFAPAVTYTVPIWCGDEAQFECGRKMLPIWRKAAEIELRADFFPQMTSTGTYGDFFCIHFYDKTKKDGFVLFLRNRECETDSFTASLALEENLTYEVSDPITGKTEAVSGKDLKTYTAKLQPRSGMLRFFRAI